MSTEISIVRHGYCLGDEANKTSRQGNDSIFTPTFRNGDSKYWPLLPLGITQANLAGKKIREVVARAFDYYLVADTLRTHQTAKHLQFEDADWTIDPLWRGRNWGGLENIPISEREVLCNSASIPYDEDSIKWKPPGGESMLTIVEMVLTFLRKAKHNFHNKKVLIVTQGSPAQAMRIIQHNVQDSDYLSFVKSEQYIRNCQILHYSHESSEDTPIPQFTLERSFYLTKENKWVESERKI